MKSTVAKSTTAAATAAAPKKRVATAEPMDTGEDDAVVQEDEVVEEEEVVEASNEDYMDEINQIIPYPFVPTDDKGRKFFVRVRENLRKYYPADLNFKKECLTMSDSPVLHVWCYDPPTPLANGQQKQKEQPPAITYCRIYSQLHNGPIFPNFDALYNAYNLSAQGQPEGVFQYAGEDEDKGRELSEFMTVNQIRSHTEFTPEQTAAFLKAVEENPILANYQKALNDKKKRKAEETAKNAKNKAEASNTDISAGGGGSGGGGDSADKKRPGRPKGSKSDRPVKRAATSKSAKGASTGAGNKAEERVVPLCLVPATVTNVTMDHDNFELSQATLNYQPLTANLNQFQVGSVERNAICWSLFSQIISQDNALGIEPTNDPESVLRQALATTNGDGGQEGEEEE